MNLTEFAEKVLRYDVRKLPAYFMFQAKRLPLIWFNSVRRSAINWSRTLRYRYLTPEVQLSIPFLKERVKITSISKISIVTTCGNRLNHLQKSLPSFLCQEYPNYEVIVSVYADREGTYEYVQQYFSQELNSGKLHLINTPAATFNKSTAVNIAADSCDGDFLLLVDCDCVLNGNQSLLEITREFNWRNDGLISFSSWGQMLVSRRQFIEIGGYDTTLGDLWAPDDADYMVRHVCYFNESYACLAPTYTFTVSPSPSFLIRHEEKSQVIRRIWVDNFGVRDADFDHRKFSSKYYQRIEGPKNSKEEFFRATIDHFRKNGGVVLNFATSPQTDGGRP